MTYWVYILRCADGTLYTGITDCLERRLAAHNSGRGAKYTRGRVPVSLVYREACPDKSAALRREYIDAYKRSEENADRMRTQISEYLEDAAKARIELDEVKRENAHLRRQLDGRETKGQTKLEEK